MTDASPLTELPDLVRPSMSVTELTEVIADIDFVTKTTYQSENGVDTTPAIVTIRVTDDTSTEDLERLAVITKLTVEELVNAEVKASIEHPLQAVTDEDGEVVDLTTDDDIETISVRWNSIMLTTPEDVRYEGYAITDEMIAEHMEATEESSDEEDLTELSEPTLENASTSSDQPTTVDWFDALGSPISVRQRELAAAEAQKMGVDATGYSDWVTKTAKYIENDRPEEAIETCQEHLDMTGAFRFLAVICTPPQQ